MGFSSSPRSCTHHVFLNFRGEDTRKGFTDHLCAALERKGIRTFRDDKNLEKGENLAEAFKRAIEESMFAITIISPDYASSSWCLNELQRIVECSKNKGLEIVTIFYNVEPTDARNQEGSFKASFEEHKKRPDREKKIQPWKEALQHISNCSDWVFKDQNEAIFVESIAEHIFKKLIPKLPSSTQNMVGVTPRVKQVIRHLGVEVKDDVRFVGILGMGGLGKTTIARAVFELIRGEFKFSCFVRNVRELSETKGFVHLQKIILSSLNVSNCDFSDEEDGKNIIKFSSCNKKVLLVLDDINDETQLKNLAGKQDWFGPGSRIIITTRDLNLLQRHRVQGTYKLKGLNLQSASRVFCLYAFENGKLDEEYSELCKKVVKYAQGLPLALEVLGSYLYGKKVDFWQDTIRELSTAPHSKIHKALKISYDHLLPAEKNIFLDIACFFKGWSKGQVISILKICNVYVGIGSEIGSGIANLIDKSLLTLNQNDELEMHDLLQEMGRHIVHEESQETPKDPGKRSRLWFKDDIDHVLTTDTGSDAIQGIALSSYHEAYWSPGAFLKTVQLKFLRLSGIKLPNGLDYLPRSLKVLHWYGCPLETLPLVDQSYQVVEMILEQSNLKQLWYGKKFLTMLKYLNLSGSWHLIQIPDLSAAPMLERLKLKGCTNLIEVHPSLVQLKKLVLLDLSCCVSIETLPGKLEMSSLEELILSGCKSLINLPEFGECMKHLSTLTLCGCQSLVSLPNSINQLKSLRILDAGGCLTLRRLPSSVSSLSLLRNLDLSFCYLISFPDDFCNLPSLTDLDLIGNPLLSLPISFHKLSKLRWLSISSCPNIRSLPELPSSLRELYAQNCDSLHMSRFIPSFKSCNVFASSSHFQDHVFIRLIPGSEIPSDYSINQKDGNCISLPQPDNCRPNKGLGIDLCFLLETFDSRHDVPELSLALYWNGIRLNTRKMSLAEMGPGRYRYFFVLKTDFTDCVCEGDLFELFIQGGPPTCAEILASAAQWFCSDIEILEEISDIEILEEKSL